MKKSILGVSFVLVVNLFLNLWVLRFNDRVPFSDDYWADQHFYVDQRVKGGKFDLLRAWGQTDSQWYLKISAEGYGEPINLNLASGKMDGLSYAFFPLYPLLIRYLAFLTWGNFELAAFILGILITVAVWLSINYVVGKIYSTKVSFWTATLIILFPFSLFLRSYHAEGIYILELVWWLYFLSKRQMGKAALFLAALNVTKGTGWLLNLVYFYFLFKELRKKKLQLIRSFCYLFIAAFPVSIWFAVVYSMTGDPLFFYRAVGSWKVPEVSALLFNMNKIAHFVHNVLVGHWISASQIVIFVAMCWLVCTSRKWLKPEWWWTSFLLLLVPTLTTYSTGHTSGRLALLQLPLWVYFSHTLGDKGSFVVAIVFTVFLYWGSLYFVNWYWWG